MQPTSKFGEMFQYSNPLAAAAGYVGGHVLFPMMELGAAYDRGDGGAGLRAARDDAHDLRLRAGARAAITPSSHSLDIDGKPALAAMGVNYSILPVRPAGGAWSSVTDVLKYVQMELAEGPAARTGRATSSEAVLKARQEPQVSIGKDDWYGMGLMVDQTYGTPVVHHGGSMIGYKSDMMWLPEHGVGAVVLTNARPGLDDRGELPAQAARGAVRRQARGRQRRRGGGQGDEGADRGRAQAAHRPARPGGGREAGLALRERRARRDRRDEGGTRPSSTSASSRARSRHAAIRTARSPSSPRSPASTGSSSSWGPTLQSERWCSGTRSTSTRSRRGRAVHVRGYSTPSSSRTASSQKPGVLKNCVGEPGKVLPVRLPVAKVPASLRLARDRADPGGLRRLRLDLVEVEEDGRGAREVDEDAAAVRSSAWRRSGCARCRRRSRRRPGRG